MSNLEKNLINVSQYLFEINSSLILLVEDQNYNEFKKELIDELLRKLNFEINEFFENLSEEFIIENDQLNKILNLSNEILHNFELVKIEESFNYKLMILELQNYLLIHILFAVSMKTISNQKQSIPILAGLTTKLSFLSDFPSFEIIESLETKKLLEQYISILGSKGDLYYLLCSNFHRIEGKYFIEWSSLCFKNFNILDSLINNYNPLEFLFVTNQSVADFYREIVSYYTVLGNTNATNLLEFIIGTQIDSSTLKIDFNDYIQVPTINELIKKLEHKKYRLNNIVSETKQYKGEGKFFNENDEPLEIISLKLLIALGKYFDFSIKKIKAFEKEVPSSWNQLLIPSSIELREAINSGKEWLDYALQLTEENENILDTPFGGLFNSVIIEFLYLVALDGGKEQKITYFEEILDYYGKNYLERDPVMIIDFFYAKTYAQIYLYTVTKQIENLKLLIEEFRSFIFFMEYKPYLKINSLLLIIILEKIIYKKKNDELDDLFNDLQNLITLENGLIHIRNDLQKYMQIILELDQEKQTISFDFKRREQPKTLDINSWLIPPFHIITNDEKISNNRIKFLSFNQNYDRIVWE